MCEFSTRFNIVNFWVFVVSYVLYEDVSSGLCCSDDDVPVGYTYIGSYATTKQSTFYLVGTCTYCRGEACPRMYDYVRVWRHVPSHMKMPLFPKVNG